MADDQLASRALHFSRQLDLSVTRVSILSANMSRHPEVKWAERIDKVYLTVLLPDAKNVKANLEPDGVFTFYGTAGTYGNVYELKLDLHDKVNVEDSKINIGLRNIFCVVEKAEKNWWKKLLRGDAKTPHYVKVDWDKWVDDDDNAGPGDLDLGGVDFSNFGNMGGMGMDNMGGMGMGGMDDELDDTDDEEQAAEKTEDAHIEEDAGKDVEASSEVKAETAPST